MVSTELNKKEYISRKIKDKNRKDHPSIAGEKIRDYNYTCFYLLPLIDLDIVDFDGSLKNCYLYEDNDSFYLYCVLNKPTSMKCEVIKSLFPPDKVLANDKYTMYAYNLDKYKKEVDLFLAGKVHNYPASSKHKCFLSNGICYKDYKDNIASVYATREDSLQFELIGCMNTKYIHKAQATLDENYNIVNIESDITRNVNPLYLKRVREIGMELPEDAGLVSKSKLRYKVKLKEGGEKWGELSLNYFLEND